MIDNIAGKTVLVTGGTGSIGREIVRQVLARGAKHVRIYSRDEHKQYQLASELATENRIRFLLGDVRDKTRLTHALEGVDVIFHTAALKHVPGCEYNPFEAVKTNVFGVQNLIESALLAEVPSVVNISTDKAVNPSSTMGVTKLLAEKLFYGAHFYKGSRQTVFATVRLGNVMGSRSSVVPEFIKQALAYRQIGITDMRMTRFVINIDKAVDFILHVAAIAQGGEIYIMKMPKIELPVLAEAVKQLVAATAGITGVQSTITGIRKGEKLAEELLAPAEWPDCRELPDMVVLTPGSAGNTADPADLSRFSSITGPYLEVEARHDMITHWLDTPDGRVIKDALRSLDSRPHEI